MGKILLYTHVDLDGVACAVFGVLAYGAEIEVQYAKNPKDCTERLVKLCESDSWKKYDRIFVTDMSFVKAELVGKTKNDAIFSKMRVFDHHATALSTCGGDSWATITETKEGRLTCGAELFHDYLLHKGLIQARGFFVEQVRLYDTWDWSKGTSRIPYFLSTLVFTLGFNYFVNTFVERLAKTDLDELTLFNQYERDILEFRLCQIEKESERYAKAARKVTTSYGTFGFVFVGEGVDVSSLGHRICDSLGVDAALMLYTNSGKLSVRTDKEGLDVGAMLREVFGGTAGGHAKSGGAVRDEAIVKRMVLLALSEFGNIEI